MWDFFVFTVGKIVRDWRREGWDHVPPLVPHKLVELGIRQNEPFNICRAERREGNRRFVDWVVQPSESAPPAPRKPRSINTDAI